MIFSGVKAEVYFALPLEFLTIDSMLQPLLRLDWIRTDPC
jgi:hypothetical protein